MLEDSQLNIIASDKYGRTVFWQAAHGGQEQVLEPFYSDSRTRDSCNVQHTLQATDNQFHYELGVLLREFLQVCAGGS